MSTALVIIETMTGIELFKPGAIDPILAQIEAQAREEAAKLDISTESNRAALASLAYKIARSKTFFDKTGKDLTADKKKEIAAVDAERRRVWDRFESLQEEVRKPLTEWEQRDKERIAGHEDAIAALRSLSTFDVSPTTGDIEMAIVAAKLSDQRKWEEFAKRASDAQKITLFELEGLLIAAQKIEAQRIEDARLAEEARERAIKEREESAAKAAKEEAERIAYERAEVARKAAESERQRLENERIEADARAKQAEAQRIASEERAKRESEQAEARRAAEEQAAVRRAAEAAEQARRAQEAAVESERQRVANEARKEREAAEIRERNKAHKAKVNRAAKEAFMRATGLDEEGAEAVVSAIAKGSIPNVTISY